MENQAVGKVVATGISIEQRVSKNGKNYLVFCAVVNGKKQRIGFVPKELEFEFYKAGFKL